MEEMVGLTYICIEKIRMVQIQSKRSYVMLIKLDIISIVDRNNCNTYREMKK